MPKAFWFHDCKLRSKYLFSNPYRVSASYLRSQNAQDPHTYGETPIHTMKLIANHLGLNANSKFLDLGSGTGRIALFLHHTYGASALGVDCIKPFIDRAKSFENERLKFSHLDMCAVPLDAFDCIYLAGTCLSDELIRKLIKNFKLIKRGAQIITVSFPLSDYDASFKTSHSFSGDFLWGKSEIFFQTLT